MAVAHTYEKKLWVEGVASMAAFEKKRSRLKLCMVWQPLRGMGRRWDIQRPRATNGMMLEGLIRNCLLT